MLWEKIDVMTNCTLIGGTGVRCVCIALHFAGPGVCWREIAVAGLYIYCTWLFTLCCIYIIYIALHFALGWGPGVCWREIAVAGLHIYCTGLFTLCCICMCCVYIAFQWRKIAVAGLQKSYYGLHHASLPPPRQLYEF